MKGSTDSAYRVTAPAMGVVPVPMDDKKVVGVGCNSECDLFNVYYHDGRNRGR